MRPARAGAALGFVGIVTAMACQDPTAVTIEVRTNVPFKPGIATSFTVGSPGTTENADATTEASDPWGPDGFVGTLAVVPSDAKDAPLSVRVVMGVLKDPRDCSIAKPDGCIIARRLLRYTPHETLRLPVTLYSQCIGVPCDASSTCNYLGQCVSAEVDPGTCSDASGCAPKDEPPPQPGDGGVIVVTPPPDAASDAGGDASADAANDGAVDASGSDAGDAGDSGSTAGVISCGSMSCPTTNNGRCCLDTQAGTGQCISGGANCAGNQFVISAACDGNEDCMIGLTCCAVTPTTANCQLTSFCTMGGYTEVCQSGTGCKTGSCTGTLNNGKYKTCQ